MTHATICARSFGGRLGRVAVGLLLAGVLTAGGAALWAAAGGTASSQADYLLAGRKDPLDKMAWKEVLAMTFENPAELAKLTTADGRWEIRDGKLWAVEGEKNRTILLGHVEGQTLRAEFDITCYASDAGLIGDITLMLNAPLGGKGATGRGYALTTGSYYNTCTTFYREGKKLARTELSPVESGKANHVIVEFDNGHIRYWLNDKILLEDWHDNPLTIDPSLWVGLRTYATRACVDNFKILRPADR